METKKSILVLGSDGLLGSATKRSEYLNSNFYTHFSNRNEAELTDLNQVENLFKKIRPNIVINCAGKVGGILANTQNQFEFLHENLKITLNIFEMMKSRKNLTLINFGSSAIYPKNASNPLKEEYLMTGEFEPSNASYSLSKIVGIELGKNIKINGNNVINLIPSNLYGPNDNFDLKNSHVVPGLIAKLHNAKINNDAIYTVWGSGSPLREFLYVDDLINAIEIIIKNRISKYDVINVGGGEEISIKTLAELIKKLVEFEGELVFDNSKPDGISKKMLDSSLIKNESWNPKCNLQDGLEKTYEWYISNND